MGMQQYRHKIKILVVEDNYLLGEIIMRGVGVDSSMEVMGRAANFIEARQWLSQARPDVIICNSRFSNLTQYQIPIVLMVNRHQPLPQDVNEGFLGTVTKPDIQSVDDVERFILALIDKIQEVPMGEVSSEVNAKSATRIQLIAIGASTGGTEALFSLLKELPGGLPGIVIVQHIPPIFSKMFAERLNQQTEIRTKEATSGDMIEAGHAYIAPGDRHMKIGRSGDRYRIECYQGERVNGHCPSVDVLMQSVAKAAGKRALGILLTGMGSDGAKGLLAMRISGARTVGQDESTSVVYGMPKVAFEIGAVEFQLPLERIAEKVLFLMR